MQKWATKNEMGGFAGNQAMASVLSITRPWAQTRSTMRSGGRIVALSIAAFSFIVASCPVASAFVAPVSIASHRSTSLRGSFFDDLFGNNKYAEEKFVGLNEGAEDDENAWDASGLAAEIERRNADSEEAEEPVEEVELTVTRSEMRYSTSLEFVGMSTFKEWKVMASGRYI